MSLFKRKTLKKAISTVTAITTVVWLSGISMLAVTPAIAAVVDGSLVKSNATNSDGSPTYESLDVYIVKLVGTKKFKRLILNPTVFESYGHLNYGDIQTVSQAVMDGYATSGLVRVDTDPDEKVYAMTPDGDIGSKSWVNLSAADFLSLTGSEDGDSIYTINATDGGNYNTIGDVTTVTELETYYSTGDLPEGTVVGGDLTVALSAATPASASVPKNAANVYFTGVNFTAGTDAAEITGIKVTRTGLGIDSNISSVKLFVDGVQRGTAQSLGSTHQATFSLTSNPIEISAGTTQEVILAADIIAAPTSYDMHELGIASAADVTTTSSISGSFPIAGNTMTLANVSIGTATLYNGSLHPTSNVGVDPTDSEYRFTQLKLSAGSVEGLDISQITAVKNGTAANGDVKNIELYNDTTGSSLGTVAELDSDGRAVFSGLNLSITKGGYVELSIKADMDGGSGRTLAFDLHDGTSYTMLIEGATYGYGITPTRSNFCAANGTCQTQTINQGYLSVSKSVSAPATGKVAVGGSGVPLMAFDFDVAGEPVNVSQTIVRYTTADGTGTAATGIRTYVTNVTLYLEDGTILAGPKDGSTANSSVGVEALTFTDAYTLPIGTTVVYAKADLSSSMTAGNTVVVDMQAGQVTAKGANSGKTTYTTSAGTTVPPSAAITGNTMTLEGASLAVITAATPIAGNMVINAQNEEFAYFDLDASAGGEDIRVSSVVVTDTLGGGAATYVGLNNLELWGDPDNTDGTAEDIRLETSNSTATNGATVTFTFKTPIIISKTASSRLTLKADVVNNDVDGGAVADTHAYKIAAVGNVTAVGNSTGNTASKSVSGAGQAQTLQASGRLAINKAADMPSALQLVSATTGTEVMKYKLTSSYEPIDVTSLVVYSGDNTQGGVATTLANVSKVYLYADGSLVGNTAGYTLDANGRANVTLAGGTLVVPKDDDVYLTVKVDIPVKAQVTTSTGADFQIGLEEANTNGTVQGEDNSWGTPGSDFDYWMVATGQASGATIAKDTINNLGTDNATNNVAYGSNGHSIHKGILTVTLNSSSPTGTASAGTDKEVLRLDLTATGDTITIKELELAGAGTAIANFSGTGSLTVKSSDESVTYGTVTQALSNTHHTAVTSVLEDGAASIGTTGTNTAGAKSATGEVCAALWTNIIEIEPGTVTIKIFTDTTGSAVNNTLQVATNKAANNNVTMNGISYFDSTGVAASVGDRKASANSTHPTTKNLPVTGNTLTY